MKTLLKSGRHLLCSAGVFAFIALVFCLHGQHVGTVRIWGYDPYYPLGRPEIPPGLTNVVAIAAGHHDPLVLLSDGTATTWAYGTNVLVFEGHSNIVDIAAEWHTQLILKGDGSLVSVGDSRYTNIPAQALGVVSIVGGGYYVGGLKADGTACIWGFGGSLHPVPEYATNLVSLDLGYSHYLAIKSGDTVVGWGDTPEADINLLADHENVAAVNAGHFHSVVVYFDGTVKAWGWGRSGVTNVPPDATQISA